MKIPAIATLLFFICLFLASPVSVIAQEHENFESNETLRELYVNHVIQKNQDFTDNYIGEYKKEFKEYFEKRSEDAQYLAKRGIYLFEPTSLAYLDQLKNKIAIANPTFKFRDISIVIARYAWANAYSTGDGTIAIIPELVTYYENEDQLTFIMCHEFAHYFADHSNRGLTEHYDKINSWEFEKKKNEIERAKYGQNTKLISLLNDNLYSQRKHSRGYEREADSLGLVLYMNASLCNSEAHRGVAKLKDMGQDFNPNDRLIFDRLKLPKTVAQQTQMIEINDIESDWKWEKVKSHPDVPERSEWIKNELAENDATSCRSVASTEFEKFKRQMEFESCNILIRNDMIDEALIRAERLRVKYPDSDYLKAICGYSMYRLYYGRKHHDLFECSRQPSPNHKDPDLVNVLNSFYYARLSKLRSSTYNYLKLNYTVNQQDWMFLVSYARMINDMKVDDPETMARLKSRYVQFYPNGKFAKYFPYSTK